MPVTPFDFDVITGPSVPRDDRQEDQAQDASAQQQAGTPPAPSRQR